MRITGFLKWKFWAYLPPFLGGAGGGLRTFGMLVLAPLPPPLPVLGLEGVDAGFPFAIVSPFKNLNLKSNKVFYLNDPSNKSVRGWVNFYEPLESYFPVHEVCRNNLQCQNL